jgi:hypothetical protein
MDLAGALLDRGLWLIERNWLFLAVVLVALALWRWGRSRGAGSRVSGPPTAERDAAAPGTRHPVPTAAAVVIIVALSLTTSLAKTARDGVALPQFHDDYAYLLAADTFRHGHLSYPPHPFAEHFETMHVLQRPRYVAKFPPGEGLLLAGGMLLGTPLAAVWLMTAAACVAIWWALRIWLGPRLALLGGLLAAIHPTILRWAQVYHSGAIAACAGALLLGAAGTWSAGFQPAGPAASGRRSRPDQGGWKPPSQPAGSRRSKWLAAAVAGIALALLAVSRPYEGLVFAAAVFAVTPSREWLRVAPFAIVALLPLALYNRAITGSALTLPYSLYEQKYDPTPNFLWQSPRDIHTWPNAEMTYNYEKVYAAQYRRLMAPGGLATETVKKVDVIRFALFGPPSWLPSAWWVLVIPLIALPRALRRRREARLLGLTLLLFAFAPFSMTWWLQTHYLAPATAVAAALLLLLLDELASMSRFLAIAVVVVFVIDAAGVWQTLKPGGDLERRRQAIAQSLSGKVVVFVSDNVFDSVYNGGDIDAQRVVWARDLGQAKNRALLAYYRDRRGWLWTEREAAAIPY